MDNNHLAGSLTGQLLKNLKTLINNELGIQEKFDKQKSIDEGKKLRKGTPRSTLGKWDVAKKRNESIELLKKQEETRVPELIPIRHQRNGAISFCFLPWRCRYYGG